MTIEVNLAWIAFLFLIAWVIIYLYFRAERRINFNHYCLGSATVVLVLLGLFLIYITFRLKYPYNAYVLISGLLSVMAGFYPTSKIRDNLSLILRGHI